MHYTLHCVLQLAVHELPHSAGIVHSNCSALCTYSKTAFTALCNTTISLCCCSFTFSASVISRTYIHKYTHTQSERKHVQAGWWAVGRGLLEPKESGRSRLVTEGGGTVWRKVATRGIRGTGWRAHGASWKGRQHTGGSHNPSRARVFAGASNRQRNE